MSNARSRAQDDKDFNSEKISELCRYIGFGLLASYYAVTLGDPAGTIARRLLEHPALLSMTVVWGSTIVLFDYLQYVFGYWSSQLVLWRDEGGWNANSPLYVGRQISFLVKQGAALCGAVSYAALIVSSASYA
jgi:hypothetical protein